MRDTHTRAVEDHYDRSAERWRSIYRSDSFHDHLIRDRLDRSLRLIDALPPVAPAAEDRRALDAGCGAGQLVAELSRRGCAVSGFDIAANMVSATRELLASQHLRAEVGQADGEHLPFPDAAFDLVTALGYLEYFTDPAAALAELVRVARPGATLIVTTPNPVRASYLLDPAGAVRGYLRPEQGYRRRYYRRPGLRRLLQAAGLHVEHQEGHGLGPFTVGGRRVLSDPRSVALDRRLTRALPAGLADHLGANLIAVARKASAPLSRGAGR